MKKSQILDRICEEGFSKSLEELLELVFQKEAVICTVLNNNSNTAT